MKKPGRGNPSVNLFGVHAVEALLQRHPERVLSVSLQAERRVEGIEALLGRHGIPLTRCSRAELDRLQPDAAHQGVVAAVRPAEPLSENALDDIVTASAEPPLLLALDGVQDPHNLGACLRTAEAAGARAVLAPRDRAVGLTPAARKVASGAAELVPFIQVVNLVRSLKRLQNSGVWIVGTAGEAQSTLYEARLDGPVALVMGGEGAGLRRLTREQCDEVVRIPMPGMTGSLNISVAAGICLFEAVRRRVAAHPAAHL